MQDLKERKVWAVWDGHRKEYVSAKDGTTRWDWHVFSYCALMLAMCTLNIHLYEPIL